MRRSLLPYQIRIPMSDTATPIQSVKTPVHQVIPTPQKRDLLILRFLILIGVVLLAQFLYWYFNEAHVGHKILFWALTVAFGYKMMQMVVEWYYFASISIPKRPESTRTWTVDMLTTFVPGEPHDMIVETLTAMVNVRYPHTTYLCDEGNDPYLKQVCEELGVVHVYRGKDKTGAKAGNINYALQHYASGELCIILDPDHVPVPEFIDQVVPYFENPQVGYVQCIQGYSNHNESFIARGAAEQTYLFYGPMMMGMQRRGTVQAIGANCTFRREALDSINGHATGLCEDMHTSMQLHAKKWKSVYVPELLTRGRVPASLSAYYQQQLKWTRGSFELLFEVYPKLFSKLNWKQRFHYFLGPLYFFYGVIALIDLGVPIISLFSFQVPLFIELEVFFMRILPVLLCTLLIRHYVQRYILEQHEEGFYTTGGILRVGTWWIYLVGFIYSIFRIKVPYIPTPKEGESHNEWKISLPNIAVIVLSAIAIAYGLHYDQTPFTWMMASFAGINIIILGIVVVAAQRKLLANLVFYFKHETLTLLDRHWSYFRYNLVYRLIRNASFAIFIAILALGTSSIIFSNPQTSFLLTHSITPEKKQIGWVLSDWHNQKNKSINLLYHKNNAQRVEMQAFQISGWEGNIIEQCNHILEHCAQQSCIPFIHWKISNSDFKWACRQWDEPLPEKQQALLQQLSALFQAYEQPAILYMQLETEQPEAAKFIAKENMYQLVYENFKNNGAANLTLAWEFSPDLRNDFPGKQYVDLTVLPVSQNLSIKTIQYIAKQSDRPVLLTANHADAGTQQQSFAQALVKSKVPIIGYLQHSDYTSIPAEQEDQHAAHFTSEKASSTPFANFTPVHYKSPMIHYNSEIKQYQWLIKGKTFYVKGVAYNPGHNWRDGRWYPTRRILEVDFARIKAMGANTLSWYESSLYNKNVLNIAAKNNLKVIYSFWIDPKIDYFQDIKNRERLKRKILRQIKRFNDHNIIIAWNLSSGTWSELEKHFHQPYLTEVRRAYTKFINELSLEIKHLDENRPIIVSLDGSRELAGAMHDFYTFAPAVDVWGVSGYNTSQLSELETLMSTKYADQPYLVSEFGAKLNGAYFQSILKEGQRLQEPSSFEKARLYSQLWSQYIQPNKGKNLGGIAYCWRDRYEGTTTFSGIIDYKGRIKPTYYALKEVWTGKKQQFPLVDLQLKMTRGYEKNQPVLRYIVQSSDINRSDLTFDWYLCEQECLYRTDEISIQYNDWGSFLYKVINKLRQLLRWNFYLDKHGSQLYLFKEDTNKYQRIYLHIADKKGNVVTISYPVEP